MAKLTLTDLTSLANDNSAVSKVNTNNAAIEAAFENTLSRDGTSPNAMGANLDMNGHQIINVGGWSYTAGLGSGLTVDGAFTASSTSTFTGAATFNGTVTLNAAATVAAGLTANAITVSGAAALTTLTVSGSTTLGDNEADTVTVNGRIVQDDALYAGGTTYAHNELKVALRSGTGSSDDLTATRIWAQTGASAGNHAQVTGARLLCEHTGSQTITSVVGARATGSLAGSGTCTSVYGMIANIDISGGPGTISTNVQGLRVGSPAIAGSTTVPAAYGLYVSSQGHANVTDAVAIHVEDQTSMTGSAKGLELQVSAGTNKWNVYGPGTANNYLEGNFWIGNSNPGAWKFIIGGTAPASGGSSTAAGLGITFPSGATSEAYGWQSYLATEAAAFTLSTLTHVRIHDASVGAGSTIGNQFGVHVANFSGGSSVNASFYSSQSAGANKYCFLGDGGARAYIEGDIACGVYLNDASAKVQIDSTTKGFLPPRMTTAQRSAIGSPAQGLMVYNTDKNRHEFYGDSWSPIWTVVTKLATESRSSTVTLANDSELTFPMEAQGVYKVRGKMFFVENGTPGIKVQFSGPAGMDIVLMHRKGIVAGAAAESAIAVDTSFGASFSLPGSGGGAGMVEFDGVIDNGANAGTFAVQWAQNVSDVNATDVYVGSYLEYMRIA